MPQSETSIDHGLSRAELALFHMDGLSFDLADVVEHEDGIESREFEVCHVAVVTTRGEVDVIVDGFQAIERPRLGAILVFLVSKLGEVVLTPR